MQLLCTRYHLKANVEEMIAFAIKKKEISLGHERGEPGTLRIQGYGFFNSIFKQ